MADTEPDAQRPDLELEVGTGVPVELRHLVSASSTFAKLINEVAEAYTQQAKPVKWVVEVQPGSVRLPLKGAPTSRKVRPGAIHEIGSVIADGLAQLAEAPQRPDWFTDKALLQAKSLAELAGDELPIAVRNGGAPVSFTKELSVNVEKLLGKPQDSYGTIEGVLDTMTVRGREECGIAQPDGTNVTCKFGKHFTLDDALPYFRKRVAARGKLKRRPNGAPISVEVESLRTLGENPIDPDDVRGILRGHEVIDW